MTLPSNDSRKNEADERKQLTDSPWFWAYIFATAALIALALAAPKYQSRQTQLERRFLARQEGGQTIKGDDGRSIETPTGNNLILRLGPLFVIVGSLLVVAWSRFWWTRLTSRNDLAVDDADNHLESVPAETLEHSTAKPVEDSDRQDL